MSDNLFIQPVKVAVIDDNIEFGAGIKILLAKEGVEVHTAADGPEGLELVKQLLPDIVLLDVVMPGMDGIEVCKKIRQTPELAGVYIVMLSSLKIQSGQMAEGLEAGADGYIARPIPNRELLARLRAYIRMKRAEKALEITEQKYRRIADNVTDVVWVTDLQMNPTYISPSVERVFGIKPAEYLKLPLSKAYPPASLEKLQKTLTEELAKEQDPEADKNRIIHLELERYYADGTLAWAAIKATFIRDEQMNPVAIQGVSQDITERKKAEEALRESEARFRTIFEIASLGIAQVDPSNGKILLINSYFETITGFKKNELLKMTFLELTHPEDREKDWEIFSKAARGEIEYRNEKRYIKKDGASVWVRIHLAFIRDRKGNPIRTVAICEDITESKKAEKELVKLSSAVEQSPVSILITDFNGNIEYVNPWSTKITGYTQEEVQGKNPRIFQSGNHTKAFYEDLWNTILEGKDWSGEIQNKKKNGDLYWESTVISPVLNENSVITNFIAIKEDITFRKQAEETLKQLEIAQKTARFKQDFLAKMSHEIRTPLAGLLGMIDVLEQTRLSEEQLQYMQDMKVSGENLKGIINMVLEYSRIEAGKVTIKPEVFEFKTLLENTKTLFRDRLSSGVECIVDIEVNIPPFIKADKLRLSQVINNLVSNAVKFTQQGSITLNARLEKPENAHNPMLVKIQICDTGKGVPDNMQEKLFKPFVQNEDDEISMYEGTGLGLSICKEIIDLMQGEIGFESNEGKGSIFWFTFSAEKAEEIVPVQKQISTEEKPRKIRVLFAEDMLVLQKVTGMLLKSAGHEVQAANNGQHLLELFKPGHFDLILMDVNMPVMDGVKATLLLKEKYTHLPPIVGLSAYALEGDREKYLGLGMDDYMVKPFNLEDFNKLLSRLLNSI